MEIEVPFVAPVNGVVRGVYEEYGDYEQALECLNRAIEKANIEGQNQMEFAELYFEMPWLCGSRSI